MREGQLAGEALGHGKARSDRAAQDVLEMNRLAGPHQGPVEHGMDQFLIIVEAIGQLEIIGRDPLVPIAQRKTHVPGQPGRDHQRVVVIRVAAAAGGRLTEHRADRQQARGIGLARSQQLAGATVRYPHRCARCRSSIGQRGDPDQRAFAAPFEMDRQIGDQRARGDIARHWPPQQR